MADVVVMRVAVSRLSERNHHDQIASWLQHAKNLFGASEWVLHMFEDIQRQKAIERCIFEWQNFADTSHIGGWIVGDVEIDHVFVDRRTAAGPTIQNDPRRMALDHTQCILIVQIASGQVRVVNVELGAQIGRQKIEIFSVVSKWHISAKDRRYSFSSFLPGLGRHLCILPAMTFGASENFEMRSSRS
ncbi:hypothetical protein HDG37_001543 [Paraburkholderia sp. MM5384-R2]|nr:hypothetical protein [Paraburkholderia sp. MM5384-R2]